MTRCPRKFPGRRIIANLMPALMLAISACGGSGSGPVNSCFSDGPTVSNLSIQPDSAVLGEGNGSIVVDVRFDFRTRDGAQLSFIDYRLVDAAGSRLVDATINVHKQNLQGRGMYTFSFAAPTHTARRYTLQVRLVDECVERSNWAEVSFIVIEPAGLGTKTDFGVARLHGGLYVVGGRDASGLATDVLLHYEPLTGLTAVRSSMPEERYSAAVVAYSHLIFVFGGNAFGYEHDSTFVYDSQTDNWSVSAPMSRTVSDADAFVLDGMIYLEKNGRIDGYDPVVDIWNPNE